MHISKMKVCRTCMNSSAILTHIFSPLKKAVDDHKQSQCVADILNELTGCELVSNDELPQFVCETCIKMAEITLNFKRMIETSHRHFVSQKTKDHVAKSDIKVECEDLELNDICDLIDFEDLAMVDTQIEDHNFSNNKGHCYNTRRKENYTRRKENYTKRKENYTKRKENESSTASFTKRANWNCIRTERENRPPKRDLNSKATQESYRCPYCKFNSSTKGNLKTHIRTHTGERPFKCSLCPKAFAQNQTRTVHMRSHTGERPIKCPTCSKSFNQMANIIGHFRRYPKHKS